MGIAAREFELFCQPLVNARTRECAGVEILLRWNNPRQGWISPDVFIPLAEEHNLARHGAANQFHLGKSTWELRPGSLNSSASRW
ncbi:hypothetical protein A9502_30275 [Klebsiella pneumoniae]|nr:hypothetical protein A9502_30275 [Klebsiella pneumoniae]